jgi:hypothetical protein
MQCQGINYILYSEICQYTSKCCFNDENEVGTYLSDWGSCVVDIGHISFWPRAQSRLIMDTTLAGKLYFILWKCWFIDEIEVGTYQSGWGSCVVDVGHITFWTRAQSRLIMDTTLAGKLYFILWKCWFIDEIEVGNYLSGWGSCDVDVGHITCWPQAQFGLIIDTISAHILHFMLWNMWSCDVDIGHMICWPLAQSGLIIDIELRTYLSGRDSCVVDVEHIIFWRRALYRLMMDKILARKLQFISWNMSIFI